MSDTPEIKVIEMVEHEDGSATLQLDMSTAAQAMLIEAGLISILKRYIDETEVLDD